MDNFEEIKNYFQKLERTILFQSTFRFRNYSLIKSELVDDIFVCILAKLPENYRAILNAVGKEREYDSVLSYRLLFSAIKNRFFLSSDVYMVKSAKIHQYIQGFLYNYRNDLQRLNER